MELDTAAKEFAILRNILRRRAAEYNVTASQDQWRVRDIPLWKVHGIYPKITKY
jgi:hypothetical protein